MILNMNSHNEKGTQADWSTLGLSHRVLELLEKAGFNTPTPIQAASIPLAIQGNDLIATAQTGTGKTASFVLPLVDRLTGKEGTFGLILAPTREIAQQTQAVLELFGTPMGVRSIVLIGGIDMKIDAQAIATYPQVIVATPGRLCDHLERGNIWLEFIKYVVLDEADRMLDMGFADQLARIMKDIPSTRQTLVFSATISQSVEKLAKKILSNPKQVRIGKSNAAAKTVEQKLIWMKEEAKSRYLRHFLEAEKGSIIVFTRSKDGASRLWRSLHSRGIDDATVIHSDRRQSDREQALVDFKEGKHRILIATDVAGRGIHVDGVAHVINYDLPREPEDYVHRIGRTGRIGATGKATSFATSKDRDLVRRIQKLTGASIKIEYADSMSPSSESGESSGSGHSERHRDSKPSKHLKQHPTKSHRTGHPTILPKPGHSTTQTISPKGRSSTQTSHSSGRSSEKDDPIKPFPVSDVPRGRRH
jgi:ATP-dependent RNA helicase RhlE